MVKTFIYGASIDALNQIDKFFEATLDKFVKRLIEENLLAESANVDAAKTAATDQFTTETSNYLSLVHSRPLRNVIGMLPVDELAGLAEWLIPLTQVALDVVCREVGRVRSPGRTHDGQGALAFRIPEGIF